MTKISFDPLRLVEDSAAKAIQGYRLAGPEEQERMMPLRALIDYVRASDVLRPLFKVLAQSRSFREYSYLHNNGFFVLYLADPNIGLQIRLHLWAPSRPPLREQPHRHRMGFVSHVISGALHSTNYELTDKNDINAEVYEELLVSGPAHSDFANNCTGLVTRSLVALRPVGHTIHQAGETYRFPAAGIHRVDTPHAIEVPVITLTVWEPAFQPSLAYEPLATKTHARQMKVQRLTPDEYDDVVGLVLGAIGEGAHGE